MILFKNIDEFRQVEIEVEQDEDYFGEASGLTRAINRLLKYLDPKNMVRRNINIDDPLPKRLSEEDYKYLEQIFLRIDKVTRELHTLRKEIPAKSSSRSWKRGVVSTCECVLETFTSTALIPHILLFMHQDVNRMRMVVPEEIHREVFEGYPIGCHRISLRDFPDLRNRSIERFVKKFSDIESIVTKFAEGEEGFKVNQYRVDIGELSINHEDEDYVFVGWFDKIQKKYKDDPAVKEYESSLRKMPLRKLDMAYVLSTYYSKPLNEFMEKSDEYLLEIFWSNVEDIKEKLLRKNAISTPTHIINVIWSMFVDEKKEED